MNFDSVASKVYRECTCRNIFNGLVFRMFSKMGAGWCIGKSFQQNYVIAVGCFNEEIFTVKMLNVHSQ